MILQREITNLSKKTGVPKTIIDKDWVLAHFIDAIFSIGELKKKLIFKGGTCLKKCYFPEYRFSEDLDFTVIDKNFTLSEELFSKVAILVTNRAEIATHIVSLKDMFFKNEKTGYEIIVKYWGADHQINSPVPPPDRWQTSIKIEIILYELLVFPPVMRKIIHSFSDKLSMNTRNIPCYSMEEIMAEKLRALIQRKYTAPRDFYDIWYIGKNYRKLSNKKIVMAFQKKMKYKNLEFRGIEQLINPKHEKILAHNWKNNLSHQIAKDKLEDYSIVVSEVQNFLRTIF